MQAAVLEALVHAVEDGRIPVQASRGRARAAIAGRRSASSPRRSRPAAPRALRAGAWLRSRTGASRTKWRDICQMLNAQFGTLIEPLSIRRDKPRAVRPGARIAIVSPASPFSREEFDRGVEELRRLGYEPTYDEDVFARSGTYLSGPAALRAAAFSRAWSDPSVAALIAVRGGYGSVQTAAAARRGGDSPHAETVHRIQRQHVAPLLVDVPLRHHRAPRPDARRAPGEGRGRITTTIVARVHAGRRWTARSARTGSAWFAAGKRRVRCSAAP